MVRMPQSPPDFAEVLQTLERDVVLRLFEMGIRESGYLHWDELRRRPAPGGLTSEQWWAAIKVGRVAQAKRLPLSDTDGRAFSYTLPELLLEGLDDITRRASGTVQMPDLVVNPATRDRYLVNSLMEEAITSSQLEGAVTTQRVAKDMLRTGRSPRDKSERMIVNNYRAMRFIRDHVENTIKPERVCELHEILTEGTLDDPRAAGRLQLPGEPRVGVWSEADDVEVHRPPPAEELPGRLAAMCGFANGSGAGWVHPVLRAIITLFMVGHDHYFVDGNGRTARALFYWVALKQGYWLLEFVAISRVLRDAPARYTRSYLYTETDDGDVTYFAVEQVRVIRQALDALHDYLGRKAADVSKAQSAVGGLGLNHREMAIVEGLLRGSVPRLTAASHAASHSVVVPTARADLRHLQGLGLLTSYMEGRREVWTPVRDVADRVRELSNLQ